MKLQRVPKWLCNSGTSRMHHLHYIRRQNLENVYHPVSHYSEHTKVPFPTEVHISYNIVRYVCIAVHTKLCTWLINSCCAWKSSSTKVKQWLLEKGTIVIHNLMVDWCKYENRSSKASCLDCCKSHLLSSGSFPNSETKCSWPPVCWKAVTASSGVGTNGWVDPWYSAIWSGLTVSNN